MMGRDHVLSGVAVWVAGCGGLQLAGHPAGPAQVLAGAAICGYAALLPDLDQPGSLAARSLGPVSWTVSWLVVGLSWLALRVRTGRDRQEGTHRSLTHTGVCAAAVGAGLVWWLPGWLWWVGWAVGVGWLVHILGDMLTHWGCPVFWPVPVRGRLWGRVWVSPRWLRFRTERRGRGQRRARVVFRLLVVVGSVGVCWPAVYTLWQLTQRVAHALMG